jgi:hypothetical protein
VIRPVGRVGKVPVGPVEAEGVLVGPAGVGEVPVGRVVAEGVPLGPAGAGEVPVGPVDAASAVAARLPVDSIWTFSSSSPSSSSTPMSELPGGAPPRSSDQNSWDRVPQTQVR